MKGYIKTKKHNNILLCSVMKPLSFEKVLICFRLKSYFSASQHTQNSTPNTNGNEILYAKCM